MSSPHDPGLLAASLEGRLDTREQEVLTAHLAGCAECRHTLALLARATQEGLLERPSPVPRSAVALRHWLPLAAAAALVIAVATVRLSWVPTAVQAPPSQTPSAASTPHPPSPSAAAPSPASSPGTETPPDTLDPGILVTRGAARRVAGKTFRLAAGEWIDAGFDPAARLPITDVQGPDQRSALLARLPALDPYAARGERVLVVFEGTVYRFRP